MAEAEEGTEEAEEVAMVDLDLEVEEVEGLEI